MGHDFRNKPFLLRSLPILDFMSMASKLDDYYLEQAHTLTDLKKLWFIASNVITSN